MNKPRRRTSAKSARPAAYAVSGDLRLDRKGRSFLGGKRIALLEAIADQGSITHAAKAVGLSYKGAWDMVDAMNNLSEKPLVTRGAGGAQGGGTRLTEHGRQIIDLYRKLEAGHQKVISHMAAGIDDADKLNHFIKAIAMKTSARNQLLGTVKLVRKGAVNADVVLDIGDGLAIFANVTNDAVVGLGLKKGREAMALIKSSFILLSPEPAPRISARNKLPGFISSITKGAVNSAVKISLSGNRTLAAIITNEGLLELGLNVGSRCCAIIKASHVLIAVND